MIKLVINCSDGNLDFRTNNFHKVHFVTGNDDVDGQSIGIEIHTKCYIFRSVEVEDASMMKQKRVFVGVPSW